MSSDEHQGVFVSMGAWVYSFWNYLEYEHANALAIQQLQLNRFDCI